LNSSVKVADWPGFNVTGTDKPVAEKSDPATDSAEMLTAPVPVEESVIDFFTVCPTVTSPKLTEVALSASVGVVAFNCKAKSLVTSVLLAASVAVCVEVTAVTIAVNPALVALAGTVTDDGTETAESLLERLTMTPPLPAAELSVTVQLSVPAPVMEPWVHAIALSELVGGVDVPVPLRLTRAVGFDAEVLEMDN